MSSFFYKKANVWVSYPLKQGLKPIIKEWKSGFFFVWVSYPLKQGLKRKRPGRIRPKKTVWVSYPLKQGLKLHDKLRRGWLSPRLSQLSIKTRIETGCRRCRQLSLCCLSQLSIKTRIETSAAVIKGVFLRGLSQLSIKTRIETTRRLFVHCYQILFESAIH